MLFNVSSMKKMPIGLFFDIIRSPNQKYQRRIDLWTNSLYQYFMKLTIFAKD